jgi:hypothetical protein
MVTNTLRGVLHLFLASTQYVTIIALKEASAFGRSVFTHEHQCIKTYAAQLDGISPGLGNDIRARQFHVGNSDQALVLGAGMGTTATRSLDGALRILGMSGDHWGKLQWQLAWELGYANFEFNMSRCRNHLENRFGVGATPGNWNYFKEYLMDTPIGELFVDFYAFYPKAKFILTNRPAEKWVEARLKNRGGYEFAPVQEPCNQKMMNYSKQELVSLFEYHAELVRCMVPQDRLLEINVWEDPKERMNDLMPTLAEFVGRNEGINAKYPGSRHRYAMSHLRFGLKSMGELPDEACASESHVVDALRASSSRSRMRGAGLDVSSVDDPYKVPISLEQVGSLIQEAARRDCEVVVMDSSSTERRSALAADSSPQQQLHFVLEADAP